MKSLEYSKPDFLDPDSPQVAILYDAPGGNEIARIRGATAPNPQVPGQPDRPNRSEYPIVAPGTYLGTFHKTKHHGKPCLSLNDDGPVWILQDVNPRKPEQGNVALAVRVHEEWSASWRGSAGCMTLEKPGGNEFLLEHFIEGEIVSIFIPDQDWFANA